MTNIQLSSRSNEWYTPSYLVEMARDVLGTIDLDPTSSLIANETVKATKILTKEDNALVCEWSHFPVSIYLNSPGGKLNNKSLTALFWQKLMDFREVTALFWQKLMDFREEGLLEHAIFMGFSLEHIAVTQSCSYSLGNFPLCVPRRRIKFISPEGNYNSPTHSNVIVYVPGIVNETRKFKNVFSDLGVLLNPDTPAN